MVTNRFIFNCFQEEEYNKRHEIKIEVPDNLKSLLVDDWEYVTKNGQLVTLPRTPNVSEVLEDYRKHLIDTNNTTIDGQLLDELTAGLKLYFVKALGTRLLYRFEREQYAEAKIKYADKEMSDIYGAEHLARMFGKFPLLMYFILSMSNMRAPMLIH